MRLRRLKRGRQAAINQDLLNSLNSDTLKELMPSGSSSSLINVSSPQPPTFIPLSIPTPVKYIEAVTENTTNNEYETVRQTQINNSKDITLYNNNSNEKINLQEKVESCKNITTKVLNISKTRTVSNSNNQTLHTPDNDILCTPTNTSPVLTTCFSKETSTGAVDRICSRPLSIGLKSVKKRCQSKTFFSSTPFANHQNRFSCSLSSTLDTENAPICVIPLENVPAELNHNFPKISKSTNVTKASVAELRSEKPKVELSEGLSRQLFKKHIQDQAHSTPRAVENKHQQNLCIFEEWDSHQELTTRFSTVTDLRKKSVLHKKRHDSRTSISRKNLKKTMTSAKNEAIKLQLQQDVPRSLRSSSKRLEKQPPDIEILANETTHIDIFDLLKNSKPVKSLIIKPNIKIKTPSQLNSLTPIVPDLQNIDHSEKYVNGGNNTEPDNPRKKTIPMSKKEQSTSKLNSVTHLSSDKNKNDCLEKRSHKPIVENAPELLDNYSKISKKVQSTGEFNSLSQVVSNLDKNHSEIYADEPTLEIARKHVDNSRTNKLNEDISQTKVVFKTKDKKKNSKKYSCKLMRKSPQKLNKSNKPTLRNTNLQISNSDTAKTQENLQIQEVTEKNTKTHSEKVTDETEQVTNKNKTDIKKFNMLDSNNIRSDSACCINKTPNNLNISPSINILTHNLNASEEHNRSQRLQDLETELQYNKELLNSEKQTLASSNKELQKIAKIITGADKQKLQQTVSKLRKVRRKTSAHNEETYFTYNNKSKSKSKSMRRKLYNQDSFENVEVETNQGDVSNNMSPHANPQQSLFLTPPSDSSLKNLSTQNEQFHDKKKRSRKRKDLSKTTKTSKVQIIQNAEPEMTLRTSKRTRVKTVPYWLKEFRVKYEVDDEGFRKVAMVPNINNELVMPETELKRTSKRKGRTVQNSCPEGAVNIEQKQGKRKCNSTAETKSKKRVVNKAEAITTKTRNKKFTQKNQQINEQISNSVGESIPDNNLVTGNNKAQGIENVSIQNQEIAEDRLIANNDVNNVSVPENEIIIQDRFSPIPNPVTIDENRPVVNNNVESQIASTTNAADILLNKPLRTVDLPGLGMTECFSRPEQELKFVSIAEDVYRAVSVKTKNIQSTYLKIGPFAEKQIQHSTKNDFVFWVHEGAVHVMVHTAHTELTIGELFIVPRGVRYKIQNKTPNEAVLRCICFQSENRT